LSTQRSLRRPRRPTTGRRGPVPARRGDSVRDRGRQGRRARPEAV